MRLKSWETPRSGRRRNTKSKLAAARLRQKKKQRQQLRQRLLTPDSKSGVIFESFIVTSESKG